MKNLETKHLNSLFLALYASQGEVSDYWKKSIKLWSKVELYKLSLEILRGHFLHMISNDKKFVAMVVDWASELGMDLMESVKVINEYNTKPIPVNIISKQQAYSMKTDGTKLRDFILKYLSSNKQASISDLASVALKNNINCNVKYKSVYTQVCKLQHDKKIIAKGTKTNPNSGRVNVLWGLP
jgi:hypothetical protein